MNVNILDLSAEQLLGELKPNSVYYFTQTSLYYLIKCSSENLHNKISCTKYHQEFIVAVYLQTSNLFIVTVSLPYPVIIFYEVSRNIPFHLRDLCRLRVCIDALWQLKKSKNCLSFQRTWKVCCWIRMILETNWQRRENIYIAVVEVNRKYVWYEIYTCEIRRISYSKERRILILYWNFITER